jgi:SAM-dependent methyltransferase
MPSETVDGSVATVVEREREFHNAQTKTFRSLRLIIWRSIGEFNRNDEIHDLYEIPGKRVLLYGCGPANGTRMFIDAGALSVVGIDISDVEIAAAWERARREGYADRVDFRVADGHHTGLPDDAFDVIVGSAILHHLELDVALRELRRILAPGGRAVFQEPLAHNPILRFGRWLTPGARTEDEHPMTVDDWRLCGQIFSRFSHTEAELATIPLMPLNLLLPRRWQRILARWVTALDKYLLSNFPFLRRYARTTFLVLE